MPRVLSKVRVKKETLNAQGGGVGHYDAFRRKALPNTARLIEEYKRTVYTCANLNADGVVATPLKLYVKTSTNDKPTVLETKAVKTFKIDFLQSRPYLSKTLRSFVNVEEVVEHPALTILEKANNSRHMNGQRLKELVQLYQEVTGKAYLLVERERLFGLVKNLWVLPSQWTRPIKDFNTNSNKIVDYYEFNPPGSPDPIKYRPEDIISFLMPSIADPYVDGMAPLQASYESNEVNKKLISHEDGLLTNEARPDVVISPKDSESSFSADTARRYEREWRMKFAFGRSGGAWVPDDPVVITPVQIPARDLARLEINKWSKNDVANAFQVPFALIADASHNRQQLEAAELGHAKHGILPRCNRNACTWNDLFLSIYDESGRLFFAYDDPIPENREEKRKENIELKSNGIITANEARDNYGYAPHTGSAEGEDPNALQSQNVAKESGGQEKEKKKDSNSGE